MEQNSFPMKTLFTALVVVMAGALAAACSLPGMSFSGTNASSVEIRKQAYGVQPITPALLEKQAQARDKSDIGRPNPKLSREIGDYDYRVEPQDVIGVIVWGHPEFSPGGSAMSSQFSSTSVISGNAISNSLGASNTSAGGSGFTVQPDGTIFFPYVGQIKVGGLNTDQIRAKLAKALSKYVVDPQISVKVIGFHSQTYQLAGAIVKPGLYPITNVPVTVSQAIQAAGGILQTVPNVTVASKASATALADLAHVLYIHDDKRTVLNLRAFFEYGDKSQDRLLHAGDIVQVPDNSFDQVHLIGEVKEPGNYPLDNGQLNLAQALGAAGGLDLSTANASRIFVFRGAYSRPQIFWLDARSPEAMLLATQFVLKPQDVVYVATAGVSTWNRIISQILPTVQALYETKVLVKG